MAIEEELLNSIEQQFEAHRKSNLFYRDLDIDNQFLPDSKHTICNRREELLHIDSEQMEAPWIDLMTKKAQEIFSHCNQFIDLRQEYLAQLRDVYTQLWKDIITELQGDVIDFERLQQNHIHRLTAWIEQTNRFVSTINTPDVPEAIDVICSEYSAQIQLQLLRIDADTLMQPVLDIGCGEHAHLTHYLQIRQIEAFGMDRIVDNQSDNRLICSDWFDFEFAPDQWGTIISNHSFALHFSHQNLRKDGNYIEYAQKYMEILHSLKPGGAFHYTPSLPFIERFLPPESYLVATYPVTENLSATRIVRKR
jgi:hypothetical protein